MRMNFKFRWTITTNVHFTSGIGISVFVDTASCYEEYKIYTIVFRNAFSLVQGQTTSLKNKQKKLNKPSAPDFFSPS